MKFTFYYSLAFASLLAKETTPLDYSHEEHCKRSKAQIGAVTESCNPYITHELAQLEKADKHLAQVDSKTENLSHSKGEAMVSDEELAQINAEIKAELGDDWGFSMA